MTKPVYKIEVWEPGGASALYTIEKDIISIYCKEVVTDGVGNFNFVVPTKKNGSSYYYNDINVYDTVKIWLGYDSIGDTDDPIFVGKITKISAPLSTQQGYVRLISGLSQGEILLRRFKRDTLWEATGASTIVTELANDLGLGTTEIETDTTSVDLHVETKSYFDILKFVSDYWYDATTQIKKDFYVDINNNLVWKSRPIRTSGVESFTVGDNIVSYNVFRDIENVRNSIKVFGVADKAFPSDFDQYTEQDGTETPADDGWAIEIGDGVEWNSTNKVGSESLRAYGTVATILEASWTPPSAFNLQAKGCYDYIHFWFRKNDSNSFVVQLYAPDVNNRFQTPLGKPLDYGVTNEFKEHTLPVGLKHDSEWRKIGNPSWESIPEIRWFIGVTGGTLEFYVDGLYFGGARYSGTASDSTSQTNYGQRDLEVTDDRLLSDDACGKRAETLLLQKKDPPTQIELVVPGNTNVLVGDRLSITIPAENISSASYDVFMVEHSFSARGFITKATMVNSDTVRTPVKTNVIHTLIDSYQKLRELSRDEKIIG